MKTLTILYVLLYLSACSQNEDSVNAWQSKYRDLHFEYRAPWTLLPVLDINSQTLAGVIDNSDGKSYIIQFFDDLPKEKLTDKTYFEGIKKTMLQPNPKNKLISEDSTVFHDQNAHRQTYLMYTDKWGLLKQINLVIRTGKELITVQILFPTKESDESREIIPKQLGDFDKNVKLNGH